ncbi:4-oxalocrotonate tautomerase family protein [Dactylosporangium sp. NPDC000555]|uniref:tautomerase family protein n=1 Tax=Dactylosporangium sp. NPDC000555 TaxID=3154260 RepID=UPI0033214D67
MQRTGSARFTSTGLLPGCGQGRSRDVTSTGTPYGRGTKMPLITITMFPGRTEDQKAALCDAVTEAFIRTCGGVREGVWTIIQETPAEHWAVGGVMCNRRGDKIHPTGQENDNNSELKGS